MSLLSIVVPCYNEEENIADFYQEVKKQEAFFRSREIQIELLYVDDGSKDQTVQEIRKLAEQDERVHMISFSRNFGKESAIFAGLEKSRGDYVVLMDADLQDPPSMLPQMMQAILDEGFDSVATRRVTRKGEPLIRSFFARSFYRLMSKISKADMVDGARDYRMMTRQFVESVLSLQEYNRFTKGIFGWVGYQTKWLEYQNVQRMKGETKWSFWGLLMYSFDGIIGFSTAPLALSAWVGVSFCGISLIAIVFIFVRTLLYGDPVAGWPSLVCIILMVSGVQLFSIGVVGQYLSRMYLEIKNRPIYIVKEEI